jgi:glycosyltransferase involved in cell wall biosynthesis
VPRALPIDYDRDAWRRRWGLDNDVTPAQAGIQDPAPTRAAFVLCYFGFLNASKGGEELIAALDAVCHAGLDARLLFVGGAFGASDRTNRAYWESVQQSIAARGLTERVVATGFLRPSEVSASLCCADVCVLPYRDGASFRRGSLLAALEHGLTIVSTTPQVALPELRDGENILLVPPHDAPALATAILRLAGDAALRQRLGVGARELSREFGWEQIAARTLEVFHAVIES